MNAPRKDEDTDVVAVVNEKGGSGKTTCTVCLAHEAVSRGQRVLVIDMDGQRNASEWLTGAKFDDWFDFTIANVLDNTLHLDQKAKLPDIIVPSKREGIDVAPAPDNRRMNELNRIVGGRKAKELALQRALRPVFGDYDLILIDCAPAPTDLNVAAYVAAHSGLLLAVEPKKPSHSGAVSLLTGIDELNDPGYVDNLIEVLGREMPFLGLIVNNYDSRRKAHQNYRRIFEELAADAEMPFFGPPIPSLSVMELAPGAGIGLDQVGSDRAEEIRRTYARILDQINDTSSHGGI